LQALETLVRDASALAAGGPLPLTADEAEVARQMQICNACRYCEGYCAVFPAMTMRRSFTEGDLTHLANLCHGCKGCYHACQYAPPHAFGINIPATFAELRQESYAKNAWPAPMGRLFERNGTIVSLLAARPDTDAERSHLAALAGALALDDATVARLHLLVGVSRPPAGDRGGRS